MRSSPLARLAVTSTALLLGLAGCSSDDFGGSMADAGAVTGKVTQGGLPVGRARVTLLGGAFFGEQRTGPAGEYRFAAVPEGAYSLGASALGLEYQEVQVSAGRARVEHDFALGPETHPGRWDTVGPSEEALGGTNSAVLLPDGRVLFCHDTRDPILFDPVSAAQTKAKQSPKIQGCHAVTLLQDGRAVYVGGTDRDVYGPGTKQVKTYDPATDSWTVQPDLADFRWYPTLVQLPDGELLATGGGGLRNPERVNTSEVLDPRTMTWTAAGDIALGNEVSPVVLLLSGEVLMTHRPPQLYNPASRTWRRAGDFVQGNRMPNGDHADHEVVLLPDGRVLAIGYKSFLPGQAGNLLEIYDPKANRWSLGRNFLPVRSRPSVLQTPDKRVLILGGFKESLNDDTPVNRWGSTSLTDQYDPATDSYRRLAPLSIAREYHATPILVPDGRVVIVAGEGMPGVKPPVSTFEVFSPPYLFRGVRPEIRDLSGSRLRRGDSFTFDVAGTEAPTGVGLLSTASRTHFQDSGNGRLLQLQFSQSGKRVTAQVPTEAARAVLGYYVLFVMVDDIPSPGRVVQIVN